MPLVITRKLNEAVKIGSDIYVTVARIDGDKVRLAFNGPIEVPIVRTEIIGTDKDVPAKARTKAPADRKAVRS